MKSVILTIVLAFSLNVAYGKCAAWTNSDIQRVQRASAIFVAEVISARIEERKNEITGVYGRYRIIEIIKGTLSKDNSVESTLSDVGLPLTPGFVYLFFTHGSPTIDWCTGSRILKDYYLPYPSADKSMLLRIKKLVANEYGERSKTTL